MLPLLCAGGCLCTHTHTCAVASELLRSATDAAARRIADDAAAVAASLHQQRDAAASGRLAAELRAKRLQQELDEVQAQLRQSTQAAQKYQQEVSQQARVAASQFRIPRTQRFHPGVACVLGLQIHGRCVDLLAAVQRLSKERDDAIAAMAAAQDEARARADAVEQLHAERVANEEFCERLAVTSEQVGQLNATIAQVGVQQPAVSRISGTP